MAHFAELDSNDLVLRVLVVPDAAESYGQEYLAETLGLGGTWMQTSYTSTIRVHFAGVGYQYDRARDAFIAPQPYPSWSLNDQLNWVAPVPPPPEPASWDEATQSWVISDGQ